MESPAPTAPGATITNVLNGVEGYAVAGLSDEQAANELARSVGGEPEKLPGDNPGWMVRSPVLHLITSSPMVFRITRHSGRSRDPLMVIFEGNSLSAAVTRYNEYHAKLRQGTLRLELPGGQALRSTSAPRLRSRW